MNTYQKPPPQQGHQRTSWSPCHGEWVRGDLQRTSPTAGSVAPPTDRWLGPLSPSRQGRYPSSNDDNPYSQSCARTTTGVGTPVDDQEPQTAGAVRHTYCCQGGTVSAGWGVKRDRGQPSQPMRPTVLMPYGIGSTSRSHRRWQPDIGKDDHVSSGRSRRQCGSAAIPGGARRGAARQRPIARLSPGLPVSHHGRGGKHGDGQTRGSARNAASTTWSPTPSMMSAAALVAPALEEAVGAPPPPSKEPPPTRPLLPTRKDRRP